MIGIYKFTNKYNRKVYIGKSKNIDTRYKGHIRSINKGKTYFCRALSKYGIDGFDFEVIHECPESQLNYWEKFYIKYYGSNYIKYGYNMTSGGDGGEWTEERKILFSNSQKGHPGYTKGMTSPMKGKHLSEEAKQKIREANLGKKYSSEINNKKRRRKPCSEETKLKLSIKMKGRKPSNLCIERSIESNKNRIPSNKGKHKVFDDETNTSFHFE